MVRPPRFHTRPLHRRRMVWWKRFVPWLTFALIAGAAAVIMRLPDSGGSRQTVAMEFTLCGERTSQGCVIDGDTIMIGRRKIRMTGFNAPEIAGECAAERALAIRARSALRDWLNDGPFTMDGSQNPPRDQYGRELRAFKRGQTWLSDYMITRNLAQQSGWGFARGGWCD